VNGPTAPAAVPYVVPAEDRAAFLGCRRAWDLGARERGNHRRATVPEPADRGAALRQALAVYYFPGMWDWQPGMVLRLVRMAYLDELSAQRDRYLRAHHLTELDPDADRTWTEARDEGLALLEHYFAWAPEVDELSPVLVGGEFDIQVPDPAEPGRGMVAPGGRAVHYRDRIDLLVLDAADGFWMVEHRVRPGPFPEPDVLRLSERCLSWVFAWELFHPGMRIEGTVYNELRDDGSAAPRAPVRPRRRGGVAQNRGGSAAGPLDPGESEPMVVRNEVFRRVVVPRSRVELRRFGERLAAQVREMAAPEVTVDPRPAVSRCARCEFRPPCTSMNLGEDPAGLLAAGYVQRGHDPTPGRLGGGTWSTGRGARPPGFGG
jgi:hypothetical protein